MDTPPWCASPYRPIRYLIHPVANVVSIGMLVSFGSGMMFEPSGRTPLPQSLLYGFTSFCAPYFAMLNPHARSRLVVHPISGMVPIVSVPVRRSCATVLLKSELSGYWVLEFGSVEK